MEFGINQKLQQVIPALIVVGIVLCDVMGIGVAACNLIATTTFTVVYQMANFPYGWNIYNAIRKINRGRYNFSNAVCNKEALPLRYP